MYTPNRSTTTSQVTWGMFPVGWVPLWAEDPTLCILTAMQHSWRWESTPVETPSMLGLLKCIKRYWGAGHMGVSEIRAMAWPWGGNYPPFSDTHMYHMGHVCHCILMIFPQHSMTNPHGSWSSDIIRLLLLWFWNFVPRGCVGIYPSYPWISSWITGWWFGTWIWFFHIWRIIIPTDELIFFRGVGLNHQPDQIPL